MHGRHVCNGFRASIEANSAKRRKTRASQSRMLSVLLFTFFNYGVAKLMKENRAHKQSARKKNRASLSTNLN